MGCLAAKPEPKYRIGARVVIDISQKDVSEYARRDGRQQIYINHLARVLGYRQVNGEVESYRVSTDVKHHIMYVKEDWMRPCGQLEEKYLDSLKPFTERTWAYVPNVPSRYKHLVHTMTISGKPNKELPKPDKPKKYEPLVAKKDWAPKSKPMMDLAAKRQVGTQSVSKSRRIEPVMHVSAKRQSGTRVASETRKDGIKSIIPSAPLIENQDPLRVYLEGYDLVSLYGQLKELGVERKEDLNLVQEDDLNCSVIMKRKFARLRGSPDITSYPPMYNDAPPAYSTIV